ncbi:amidohydrolase [Bacillus sp. S/N-304-OC-R1]|uniref:amidohydrolase n=1 Tax=Bacillus sp. S/N-304-OC-R1 TaxID=2758034 RepID=UPI001C8F1BE1|nr:amidohydrolase [Bacillus sp. S/N-304-OC-R1]MBY0123427.1 amidohydrolase [Bacillus sp. S/N-304-OC-R1]
MIVEKTIFHNGRIFTSNPNQPYASAMIVSKGRIEWIGDEKDMAEMEGGRVDLQGRRVLPGFIDAHLHPVYLANAAKQIACTAPLVHSIDDMVNEIRKQRELTGAEEWIEGWGYDEGKLTDKRAPLRSDLDRAAADVPVVVTRTCAHIISVNSKALELAGITKETPDPPGGQIDRDANGEPTGILRENAKHLVLNAMPARSIEENATLLAELSPFLFQRGITAITDLMALRKPIDYLDMYNEARDHGLKQRTVLYYIWEDLKKEMILDENKTNRENPVHIGGIKLFADGSVSGRTAWVNPAFLGDDENYGISTTSQEELLEAAEAAEKHGVQLVVHAMGERAIDQIIDTFYGKKGWLQDAPSIRIEHAAMPTEQAIKRAAETNIAFVPQPIFLFAEIESYLNNLGAERTKTTYPVQKMLEAGIKVAFSSDAPATAWADPVDPFVSLKAAVTRIAYDGTDTGQDQGVDIETAIELYTREAQVITRIPDVGQLKPGYYADFIILDQDILEVSPEKIDEVSVEATYMNGEKVFQK